MDILKAGNDEVQDCLLEQWEQSEGGQEILQVIRLPWVAIQCDRVA